MAEFLEVHHFEPLVGKTVRFKGTAYTITLDRIVKMPKFVPTAKRDPFILIFRAPRGPAYMAEGMYDCEFDGEAVYTLYIAPTHTPDQEWQDYQSIFN